MVLHRNQNDVDLTRPRSQLVSISDTPYYHVISRCVRRSYLCGIGPHSGANYEHRRQWIEYQLYIWHRYLAFKFANTA